MKKGKFIFTFLLGGLICSLVSVYAYSIASSDVSFSSTKPGFTDKNVESALNTLYDKSSNIYDRIDWSHDRSIYSGDLLSGSGVSKNINTGKYIIIFSYGRSSASSTVAEADGEITLDFANIKITNASCEIINGKCRDKTASTRTGSNYLLNSMCDVIYKCIFDKPGSFSYVSSENANTIVHNASINTIKIE